MTESRKLYLISPRRRFLMYGIWALLALPLIVGGAIARESALVLAGGMVSAIMLPIFAWVIHAAKLIITPEGVETRQTGATLKTPWSNIAALRLVHGSEGFILREPMDSRGAQRFADTAGIQLHGSSFYSADCVRLLQEQRFIPLEAFAYWLKHGDLRDVIARHAPDLRSTSEADLREVSGKAKVAISRTKKIAFIVLIASLIGLGLFLGFASDQPDLSPYLGIPVAFVLTLSAARNGIGVARFLRGKRYGSALLWACMAVFQLLFALVLIGEWVQSQ